MPLTSYERTKKFKSSEYGTTSARISGHSQYQAGDCGLSLTSLNNGASVLCTPSGHLYEKSAILEYLLTKTQEIKEQQDAFDRQEAAKATDHQALERARQQEKFVETQKLVKTTKTFDAAAAAKEDLRRTSYWLADSQPEAVGGVVERPPERPESPHSGQPLRRKELWPLDLTWEDGKLVCSVSKKPVNTQEIIAYWTKSKPKDEKGFLVLSSVFKDLGVAESKICPITSKKIRHIRTCQKSGSSFAGGSENTVAKVYRPTIT